MKERIYNLMTAFLIKKKNKYLLIKREIKGGEGPKMHLDRLKDTLKYINILLIFICYGR